MPTLSDIKTAATHGNVETRSEKLEYCKFIKDSEFETRKVFGQRNIKRESIRNIKTQSLCERRGGGVATRIADQDGIWMIWMPTLSDIKTAPTHGDLETISEKLAYCKFINDSEFETRKVFERENIERENIRNIENRLEMTRLDEDQMTRSVNISKRSENHKPEVNIDHDPSSSNLSDSSSSDSALHYALL